MFQTAIYKIQNPAKCSNMKRSHFIFPIQFQQRNFISKGKCHRVVTNISGTLIVTVGNV